MNLRKLNCWEFKKCGRQPQGHQVNDRGVCPAAIEESLDGSHDGINAGRACWIVCGTLCQGKVQGTFAQKFKNCEQCDFYQLVRTEERAMFTLSVLLLDKMRKGRTEAIVSGVRTDQQGSGDGAWTRI